MSKNCIIKVTMLVGIMEIPILSQFIKQQNSITLNHKRIKINAAEALPLLEILSEDTLMTVMLLKQRTFLRHCWHLLWTMRKVPEVEFDKSLFNANEDSIQNISHYHWFEFTEAGMKVWRYYGIGAGILVPYSIKWSFTSGLMIIKPFKNCLQISILPSQNKPRASRQLCSLFFVKKEGGHSSQIHQGSGMEYITSSSNFYHLIASMREVFAEILSFIAQFNLTLWLFKVLQIVWKFLVCKLLWFSGTSTFR